MTSTPRAIDGLLNLLTFVRVVEAGSFAEAARRAGTTTSAMSKAVARFEQAHGLRLLQRTTHALSLTPDGERLLDGARTLLQEAERLEASLGATTEGPVSGRVRVGAAGPFLRACLGPALPRFVHRYPEIDLDLRCDEAAVVDLGPEGVDIAIRSGRLDERPDLVARTLTSFPWMLCAAPAYLAARGEPAGPQELKAHVQIGLREGRTGQLQPWLFAKPEVKPALAITRHVPHAGLVLADAGMAWSLMREGLGLAWLPAWLGADDLRVGRVVEVMRAWRIPETKLSAVRLDRRPTPKRVAVVMDFLADLAPEWLG